MKNKKYRKVKIFTSDIIKLFKEYCKKIKFKNKTVKTSTIFKASFYILLTYYIRWVAFVKDSQFGNDLFFYRRFYLILY